jgi:hypothetical protein
MNNRATHILMTFGPTKDEPNRDMDVLYRAKDGRALGYRTGSTVSLGEDPNPTKMDNGKFLDATYAKAYVRKFCDADAGPAGAEIDVRNGEPRIVPANENKVLAFRN